MRFKVSAGYGTGLLLAALPLAEARAASPVAGPERTVLEPGLAPVPDHRRTRREILPPVTPPGFRALFDGKSLNGWHISQTSNHGSTPLVIVRDGMILGAQNPPGRGGLLVSNESFADFDLYLEVRSDWGNDSGVLFRVTEAGAGYQLTMDTLPCGSVGRLEGVGGVRMANQTPTLAATAPCWTDDPGMAAWKRDDWNVVQVRVAGVAPQVAVTVNGVQLPIAADTANSAVGGRIAGPIALQIHGGVARWQPGGLWRWRSIAIRERTADAR